MEVTKLSNDKSEILVQLYDSLEDVLKRANELDKKILEQVDVFNKVESELSNLNDEFNKLKSKNYDDLTTNGAKEAGNILKVIISKKKEKEELLNTDQILYKEYVVITNEIKKIQSDINNILNEEEIETLSTNQGIIVTSLDNATVHIKHTDINNIVCDIIMTENCVISETSSPIAIEATRIFKLNEEENVEKMDPHSMLINLINSNKNRHEKEQEESLDRIPKYMPKEKNKDNLIDNEPKIMDSIIEEKISPDLDINENKPETLPVEKPSISEMEIPVLEIPSLESEKESLNAVIDSINVEKEENKDDVKTEKIEDPVSEVLIDGVINPSKIANSTEAKVQTILKVWSKYKIPKTIIKLKEEEKFVPLDAILSDKNKDKKDNISDIQAFLSNAA